MLTCSLATSRVTFAAPCLRNYSKTGLELPDVLKYIRRSEGAKSLGTYRVETRIERRFCILEFTNADYNDPIMRTVSCLHVKFINDVSRRFRNRIVTSHNLFENENNNIKTCVRTFRRFLNSPKFGYDILLKMRFPLRILYRESVSVRGRRWEYWRVSVQLQAETSSRQMKFRD